MQSTEVKEAQVDLEVLNEGAEDVMALESLSCCFPSGTLSFKSAV